jgi:hypothetical protein
MTTYILGNKIGSTIPLKEIDTFDNVQDAAAMCINFCTITGKDYLDCLQKYRALVKRKFKPKK